MQAGMRSNIENCISWKDTFEERVLQHGSYVPRKHSCDVRASIPLQLPSEGSTMIVNCPSRVARVQSGSNLTILYLTELGNFAAIPAGVMANISICTRGDDPIIPPRSSRLVL
jgi:hypothetical protein